MQIEKLYKDREKSAKKADPKEQIKSKKEDYNSFLAAHNRILTEEISPKQGQVKAAGGSFASGTSGSSTCGLTRPAGISCALARENTK